MAGLESYGRLGRVKVRPMTAVSALQSMHEDVCHVAEDKGVTILILPFYKREIDGCDGPISESMGSGWRTVNQRVMENAPGSVAVLVDRGLGGGGPTLTLGVCVLFFGGPDGREALALGTRMAEHSEINVTVIRFVDGKVTESVSNGGTTSTDREMERDELDERNKMVDYVEKDIASINIMEEVVEVGRNGEYDLVVVGNGKGGGEDGRLGG
ncbi:hypothetical protein Scep_003793 [Stephania cephalantha]|uniref:Uncharacterized protein n=1 Tax=Stephania cephalantha TaxID=152367 RepID=A0AAP0KSS5_9MAGN